MADWVAVRDKIDAILLAEGPNYFTTHSVALGETSKQFRSLQEFQDFYDWVSARADRQSRAYAGRTFAKNGGRA